MVAYAACFASFNKGALPLLPKTLLIERATNAMTNRSPMRQLRTITSPIDGWCDEFNLSKFVTDIYFSPIFSNSYFVMLRS